MTPPVEPVEVDSAVVRAYPPGCRVEAVDTVIFQQALGDEGASGLIITHPGVLTGATTRSEHVCAFGSNPEWGVQSFWLALRFEESGGALLSGRWQTSYLITSVGDGGSFVGAQTSAFVVLVLTHDHPTVACTRMRLYADLSTTGAWGPMSVIDQDGCPRYPAPFQFVEDTTFPVP